MTALVLAGLLALAAPPDSAATCPGGVAVSRAELEAAGAMHLHDALRLAGVLPTVSVDGFDAEPLGLALPFAETVRVFVDGAPVARGAGPETPGLDALPVALGEVARVVVCPGDGLAAGALGGPWIDVQTRPPGRLYGAVGYGNEAGDPGPLRYTPERGGMNVDRWGPYAEGGAGTPTAWAAVRYRTFLPTDPAIVFRTTAATERYPKRVGTVGALAVRSPGTRVRAAGRVFSDLAFAAPLGREVAFGHRSAQATASGRRDLGALRLTGHVHAAALRLGESSRGGAGFAPDWSETRLDAALAAEKGTRSGGLRLEHVAADAPGLSDGTVTVGRAWARTGRAGRSATLAATAAGGRVGGGLALDGAWSNATASLRATASARRTLAEEGAGLNLWRSRGYARFGNTLDATPPPLDIARLRLEGSTERGGRRAWASVEAVGARGGVVLSRPDGGGLLDAEGVTVAGRAGVSWRRPVVSVSAVVEGRAVASGSAAFREAWGRVPRTRAVLDVRARPDGRLALWARLEARGGADWAGFPDPDIPVVAILDLGASKRAWGDRLRFSLGGRNVLGAEERTHPLGATLAPRLFVRAEVRL